MTILIARNESGQACATIHQGEKLSKSVKKSVHMLRKPMGWAFDIAILQDACDRGVAIVEVVDIENQVTYTAPISAFWKSGVLLDRGHGRQRVLPL